MWGSGLAGLVVLLVCLPASAGEVQRFVAVDNGANRLLLIDRADAAKGWALPLPAGCRDLQLVDGNRVLVSHGDGAGEYDLASGQCAWKVSGFKGVSTAQRCPDGSTLLGMNDAGGARFVWVDRDGKELRRRDVAKCADLRLVRMTESGGLLFTASGPVRVVETDAEGAIAWTANLAGKGYQAVRMADKATWATTGETCTVSVIGRDGKEVRYFGGRNAHTQARLLWLSGFSPTTDGGVVVANWCGHGKEKQGPHVVAFDASNKLLWSWEDHTAARTVTNVLALEAPAASASPIDVRVENLTVLPSTGPLANVTLRNHSEKAVQGSLKVGFPAGWKLNKTSQAFALQPSQTQRIAFAIEKGTDDPANSYPVKVQVQDASGNVRLESLTYITATTAPYFKPAIDGKRDEWKDAVPVTFVTGGKKTVISTYWSQRSFSLLVAVEEDQLVKMPATGGEVLFDAVQVAFAPRDARTPGQEDAQDQRHEFLLAARGDTGACFTLYGPDQKLSVTRQPRALAGLETPGAQVTVTREDNWTYYECSIPFKALPLIQPEPGREFCFSVLVHDPDGTGFRDRGAAAGLWPDQRNHLAWSLWQGSKWPEQPPLDNKIEWGLCSSKQ